MEEEALSLTSKRDARLQKKMEKKKNLQERTIYCLYTTTINEWWSEVAAAEQKKKPIVKRKKKKPVPASFISFAQDVAKSLPTEDTPDNSIRQGKKAKSKEVLVYVLHEIPEPYPPYHWNI